MHRFEDAELEQRGPNAFAEQREVRFQDVDAAGLIFYPRALEYFHDAYVAFLAASGVSLPAVLRERSWAAPLRHAEARYKKPLRFGDRVEVALVRARLEPTEATLGWRIARTADAAVCAIGQTCHVFVEAASLRRRELPAALRAALERIG
jgi:YbgC/YbaW family acyl-CoA thioester hydrolase